MMEVGGNDPEMAGTSSSDEDSMDHSDAHTYKALGHDTFDSLKKVRVIPKWINKGETFTSELSVENCTDLDNIKGLHHLLAKRAGEHLKRWYPVQTATLPHLLATTSASFLPSRDFVITAPTGSGKTLCFVLPILNALRDQPVQSLFALVIAPVQNLVCQIENEFKKYNVFNIRIVSLCGNHDLRTEKKQLKGANVAVATPGRLMEHLTDLNCSIDFTHLRFLVVDEADRMSQTARIEWLDDLESVTHYSHNCVTIDDLCSASLLQKILISATLSLDIEDLREWCLRHPRFFRAVKEDVTEKTDCTVDSIIIPSSLKIEIIICDVKSKPIAIYERIERQKSWKRILIFVNNKMASYRLAVLLKTLCTGKYQVEELSSNLFGNRRQKVLTRFRKGITRVLISSDLMSRGIDVEDVDVVVNYDKPQSERLFVHRVGRTARCGKKGTALSLTTSGEKNEFQSMLQKIGFSGKMREKYFEGLKDNETVELYRQALAVLKKSFENGNTKNNRKFKSRKKDQNSLQK